MCICRYLDPLPLSYFFLVILQIAHLRKDVFYSLSNFYLIHNQRIVSTDTVIHLCSVCVKCLLFLSDLSQTFFTDFWLLKTVSNFTTIHPVEADFSPTDRHDEANGCFHSFVNVPRNGISPSVCVCVWVILNLNSDYFQKQC
jgi:hypothetical protein